ncbi:putative pentatricopeptide repeat-containing protein At5g40405 [Argentina anserina]|uniref:putative pentatricopeptide repeat-containing protein At5g40405 n=1 Tax=Argentina anserina TaxID=57926 RepID=UPI0021767FFF|nr:putative pentatricopeptide repeat-containing protein At5g40405 [Potentilla anserina]
MSSLRCIAKHPAIALVDSSTTLKELKQIHAQLLIHGVLPHLSGNFVTAIAFRNPNNLEYSNQVLHQCDNPPISALNSMIRAYSKTSAPTKSFHFYNQILHSRPNLLPDNYTFNFLVGTSAQAASFETGASAHAALLKHGFENDPHVLTALISMYGELGCLEESHRVFQGISEPDVVARTAMLTAGAKCGDVDHARKVFDEMPERDPCTWNAMIAGYAQCGKPEEALDMFHLMQMEGVRVNTVCMVSVLSACSHLGVLDHGRWAHAYIERSKVRMDVTLGTALLDMYAKCGDMSKAMEVFWGMKEKNVYTWSCALGGLAMNGYGEKCLELFTLMEKEGVRPNEITFVSVLRGCTVVGLVEEGQRHFDSMRKLYGIEPQLEHYGCIVDLYGRAGRLDEALNFINNMPMKPHSGAWMALLHASKLHRNLELGELASRKVLELDDRDHCAYVLLSNIYADSKYYDGVDNVREMMKAKGVQKKVPGCSVIEVNGEVYEFFAGGNKSHPRYNEIITKLEEISQRLKSAGYVANTNPVLFDMEEEDKEDALATHSEKFAIAFGLITLREGVPIRVVNNLRICLNCHDVTKMISNIFNREIIVRDRNRFHHFQKGKCSCNDYW